MPLSQSDQDKVKEWIGSRTPQLQCDCGAKTWSIAPELAFPLMADSKTGRINYLSGYPLVIVTCNDCGRALFFSAMKLGVWSPKS